MSRQTSIEWPEDDLGCPLRVTYQAGIEPRFARTTVADGPARFRMIKDEEHRTARVSFLWDEAQLGIWESFHALTLDGGIRWFMMDLMTGRGLKPMYCHMLEGWDSSPHQELLDRFNVSFDMDVFHSAGSKPLPGLLEDPYSGGYAVMARPVDRFNGSGAANARPVDIVNAVLPGRLP